MNTPPHIPAPPAPPQAPTPVEGLPETVEDVQELCRIAAPHVIRRLYLLAMDDSGEVSAAVQKAAIDSILDRALGKAAQHIKQEVSFSAIIGQIQAGRGLLSPPTNEDILEHE